MKRALLIFFLSLVSISSAYAASDKIDPVTYICAEFVASNVDGEPPVFEGLQLDGYASGKTSQPIADSMTLRDMLIEVSASCAEKPTDKTLQHWQNARKNHQIDLNSHWRADKTLCKDYNNDPEDGSGFVIWLDGYVRGKSGKDLSVLGTQEALDNFLAACKANPDSLMAKVLEENAK